jgi:LmbE family N-acetylglucosaminyl deacetylase
MRRALRVVQRAEQAARAARDTRLTSSVRGDPDAPSIILSPHTDDAVINCWSVLASDADVGVVNVFTGVPPPGSTTLWDRICGAGDSAAHMNERVREDVQALAAAGRVPTNLGFLDSQYRRRRPSTARLDATLAKVIPSAGAVFAPAALGFEPHPDHAAVRRLALVLARSGIPLRLYADVPYAVPFGWPYWVTESRAAKRIDVDALWHRLSREVPGVCALRDAQVVRLRPAEAERKLTAMKLYRTQFAALDGGDIGLLRNPLIHSFEVFWTVEPP